MAIDKINPLQAANLYSNTQKAGNLPGVGGGLNFADLMKSGIQDVVSNLKSGEAASASAVAGKADLSDVVQSITKAEMTLQTVVAIRDRLVSAYQDILRMPI